MSLLKWKEMAEKRSKTGRDINTIRETLKQKKISDTMSDVEAEKLFKPITKELAQSRPQQPQPQPQPQPMKRRLEVPDYSIDEGIPDLFDEGVQPQSTKQLVPTPRKSVKQMIEDLEAGKKKLTTVPEYMHYLGDPPEYAEDEDEDEDEYGDPPEYVEDEIPDYEISEEDRINETLDEFKLANYEDIEMQLRRGDMTGKARHSYLSKKIDAAVEIRRKFPGYKTQVTKQLNKGLISQAEAQLKRKTLDNTRKVLNDYIKYHSGKLKSIKGSGLKSVVFLNPKEALKKLELIVGSIGAGNNSIELRNTGVAILDILLRHFIINKRQYNKIYKNFFM